MAKEQTLKPLTKAEKAAVVMLCMDENTTAELFGQMQDNEIRKVANALLRINQVPSIQIQEVLEEFSKGYVTAKADSKNATDVPIDGNMAAENMLSRGLPRGRGKQILNSLATPLQSTAEQEADFKKMIQQYGTDEVYEIMLNEHIQIQAIILANSKKKVAKEVFEKYPEDIQIELVSRMAGLKKLSGQALLDLKNYLSQKIREKIKPSAGQKAKEVLSDYPIEGMDGTIKLLKAISRDLSSKLVEEVEKLDSEVGMLISKQMFTLEDLERCDDAGIRELLRGITNDDLRVALKDASDVLKQKVFKNMSKRAAMILQEDMSVMPPLKVEEIEAAQSNILKVAKDLVKEQKITIADAPEAEEE